MVSAMKSYTSGLNVKGIETNSWVTSPYRTLGYMKIQISFGGINLTNFSTVLFVNIIRMF